MLPPSSTGVRVLPPVDFYGKSLTVIDRGGEPYIAMKPLVESMGLAWAPQHKKLQDDPSRWPTITLRVIVQKSDAKEREMTCLSHQHLAGWLMTIEAWRLKDEVKKTVELFQKECSQALWNYWSQGVAVNPRLGEQVAVAAPVIAPGMTNIQLIVAIANELAAQEQRLADLARQQAEYIEAYDSHIDSHDNLDQRLGKIESDKQAAINQLYHFPPPTIGTPVVTRRAQINDMVKVYARAHGGCYQETWQRLYECFNTQWKCNIVARANNAGVRPVIDMVESLGWIERLYTTAYGLLVEPTTGAVTTRNIFR
jgi:hypothetical protein